MHKNNVLILLVLALIFALLVFFLVFKSFQKSTEGSSQKAPLKVFSKQTVSTDDDPVMGDDNAPLTLIEFSDFECGNCKLFFLQTLPLLKKKLY